MDSLGESFSHSNWVEADLPPESSPTALIAYTGDGEVKLHRVVAREDIFGLILIRCSETFVLR